MEGDTNIPGGLRHGGGSQLQGDQNNINGRVVQSFQRSFVQVQSILDQNRLLINEIDQNQASRAPAGLSRNVGLIRELNTNIWRVVDLYAGLSTSFARPMEAPSEGDYSAGTPRSDGRGGDGGGGGGSGGKRVRLG